MSRTVTVALSGVTVIALLAIAWLVWGQSVREPATVPGSTATTAAIVAPAWPVAHEDAIVGIVPITGHDLLASASRDGQVRIWRRGSGRLVSELAPIPGRTITAIAAHPVEPGRVALATTGETDDVAEVDLRTGRVIRSWPGVAARLAYAPGGRLIAGSGPGRLSFWVSGSGDLLVAVRNDAAGFSFVDANTAMFQSGGNVVFLDLRSGDVVRQLETGPNADVALSPDGRIAGLVRDQTISVWDVGSAREIASHQVLGQLESVTFAGDGTLYAGAGSVWLRDAGSREHLYRVSGAAWDRMVGIAGPRSPRSAFAVIGDELIVGQQDGAIDRWTADERLERRSSLGQRMPDVTGLDFSHDDRFLAASDDRGVTAVWELPTGAFRILDPFGRRRGWSAPRLGTGTALGVSQTWTAGGERAQARSARAVKGLAFLAGTNLLAAVHSDGSVFVHDVRTGEVETLATIPGAAGLAQSDGVLAVASEDRLSRWTLPGRQPLPDVALEVGPITAILVHPRAQSFVVVGISGVQVVDRDGRPSPVQGSQADTFVLPDGSVGPAPGPDATGAVSLASLAVAGTRSVGGLLPVGDGAQGIRLWNGEASRSVPMGDNARAALALAMAGSGRVVAIGHRNGRVELRDAASGSRLVTLASLGGGGWLAQAPEGHFDGSPDAWPRVTFFRPGDLLRPVDSEPLFGSGYVPFLLDEVVREGAGYRQTLAARGLAPEALRATDGSAPIVRIASPIPTTLLSSGLPMQTILTFDRPGGARKLTILEPGELGGTAESRAAAAETEARVAIDVSDGGGGINECRLFRNRRLAGRLAPVVPVGGRRRIRTMLPLVAGVNEISAYCFGRDGRRSAVERVTVIGDERLRRPVRAFVVAIGVNAYRDARLKLEYARADATLVTDRLGASLRATGRYADVVGVNLLDRAATASGVLAVLDRLGGRDVANRPIHPRLASLPKVGPEDTVIMFFAGHGQRLGRDYALLAHDFSRSSRGTPVGAVTVDQLREAFSFIDAGRIMLIIDACQSGGALDDDLERRRGPFASASLAQLAYDKRMLVIAASQANEAAREYEHLRHGLLTHVLVRSGLDQGRADWDPADRKIRARELATYVTTAVPQAASSGRKGSAPPAALAQAVSRVTEPDDEEMPPTQTPRIFLPDQDGDDDLLLSILGDAA